MKTILNNKNVRFVLLAVTSLMIQLALIIDASAKAKPDTTADVRAAVNQAFEQLRAGDYGGGYDVLPTASQKRIGRAQFVEALERSRGMFELDRMEVDRVSVAGNLAVVDTVIYATLRRPVQAEGKIVSRQYMVREGGRWRVTTGDRSTVRPLLASNPSFARKFPPTEPRVYFKRDGQWISVETLGGARRRK